MGASNRGSESIWFVNELSRMDKQSTFEKSANIEQRKRLGQFFTPYAIAEELCNYGLGFFECGKGIRCLEPAFGTGVFYSALTKNCDSITRFIGYDVDKKVLASAKKIWGKENKLEIHNENFLRACPKKGVDLLITNPPYVRHQFIEKEEKNFLNKAALKETGIKLSGLSGLYCYFILLSHKWLNKSAIACWLLPSEFMDVNYGDELKEYFLNRVTLLRIHRYDPSDVQFGDALVTSAVVWYKNEICDDDYEVEFTYGGTHENPRTSKKILKSSLDMEPKWTRFPEKQARKVTGKITLGDYFEIKRGLATGNNNFFILDKEMITTNNLGMEYMTPILPSPRHLTTDYICADSKGFPDIPNSLFLIDCNLEEKELRIEFPELWRYLQNGLNTAANSYLCKARRKWYCQEKRIPAPLLCTYMGRGAKSIRFIRNSSKAVASNSFLMLYPKEEIMKYGDAYPSLLDNIWESLNKIPTGVIDDEGRIYGGGLKKIEPKELAKVECPSILSIVNML